MAFGKLIASLKTVEQGLASLAASVESHAATIVPKLDEIVNKSDQVYHRTNQLEKDRDRGMPVLNELDSLYNQLGETQNDFSLQLQLDLEEVRTGAQDISQLIARWGDAVIATKDGVRTIRELMAGADIGQYRQQIQGLITDLATGAADLGDVLAYLKENASQIGKGLIDMIELFRQGKASLEDVQRVLDATKAVHPDGDFGDLTEAIRNALLGGDLGGQT